MKITITKPAAMGIVATVFVTLGVVADRVIPYLITLVMRVA